MTEPTTPHPSTLAAPTVAVPAHVCADDSWRAKVWNGGGATRDGLAGTAVLVERVKGPAVGLRVAGVAVCACCVTVGDVIDYEATRLPVRCCGKEHGAPNMHCGECGASLGLPAQVYPLFAGPELCGRCGVATATNAPEDDGEEWDTDDEADLLDVEFDEETSERIDRLARRAVEEQLGNGEGRHSE